MVSEGLRILVSAYACEPNRGSEPGVGWNWVQQIARHNEVWVITRINNRTAIELELKRQPMPKAHFIYFDLPKWSRFWKRRRRGLHPYYYLWQIGAYLKARQLHRIIGFDVAHHVTFVTYWMPSLLALLPIPFVWGPVGGGESTPRNFLRTLPFGGIVYELLRGVAQAIGRLDPFVRLTARRSAIGFAATQETAHLMTRLGCRRVEVYSAMGLPPGEIDALARTPERSQGPFRFIAMGELLPLKGNSLALRAFAKISGLLPNSEYWLVGDGIERGRLERLTQQLRIADRVKFWGQLTRPEALAKLAECDVLVHPGLHDSGGCVCSEALAAGRPVLCLDIGGPAMQVTAETGIKIAPRSPNQAIDDLATAMKRLASDPDLRHRMSVAARKFVQSHLAWDLKGDRIARTYRELASVKNRMGDAPGHVPIAAGEFHP
jgi:glycosyltransferase involved in cell wall biosynthesis